MMRLALVATLLLSACGGGGGDLFTADMKTICNAKEDPNLPPDMQRMAHLQAIRTKIQTPEAARLLAEWIQVAPSERAALVAPALAKAKLKRCRFLED